MGPVRTAVGKSDALTRRSLSQTDAYRIVSSMNSSPERVSIWPLDAIRSPPSQTRKSAHQFGGGTPTDKTGQSRAVLSVEAVSTRCPSGLKIALLTSAVWPWKVARNLPLICLPEPRGFVP
jgi:hypothetical protein